MPHAPWVRYGVAVGAVLVAWLVRSSVTPGLGPTALPFIFFFPAIAIAAWFGGMRAALLAIVLSGMTCTWFFVAPTHSLRIARLHDAAALAAFALASFLIALPMEIMHRARARLRAREQELQRVIDGTPFMLTRCTRDLRYAFVSRAYAEMIGRKPQDLAGKFIVEIMGEEGFKTILPHVQEVLLGNRVEYESAVHFQGVGERSLRVIYTPEKDADGKVVGWIASILDVTARKKTEEALRIAHEELAGHASRLEGLIAARTAKLQDAVTELEAFSYSVAHDLRAPLRAMQGYADALLEDSSLDLNPESRNYVQRIQRAAARLDRLTREVLTYSQLSRQAIDLQTINLEKLVREIVDHYPELSANAHYIEIRSPLLPAIGHESLLTQALSNLLVNACKFMPDGAAPKVVVHTERVAFTHASSDTASQPSDAPAWVRIWIEDNGIGIAPEHRNRLFQIFGRIHPSDKYEGTGIGLAIVKKAAERMGGSVGFQSQVGKGSRFWLQLPAVQSRE